MGPTPLARLRARHWFAACALAVATGASAVVWWTGPSDGNTSAPHSAAARPAGAAAPAQPRLRHPFLRIVYTYGGTRLSRAQEGARYRIMIMRQTDAPQVARLKAGNPRLKVFMVVNMMSSDPGDPDGIFDWVGYTDADRNHPNWFLKGPTGNRLLFKDYPTALVMDVGDPAYQQAGLANAIREVRAGGFDGVFLDDVNASLGWVIAGGSAQCVKYPNDATWQAAVYSFLSHVAPQLHRAGLLVAANIGGSSIKSGLWQKWNGPLDGAMEESFSNAGVGRESIENGWWQSQLRHDQWSEAHDKFAFDHAVTPTRSGARYGLATMLLVANGKSLFMASTDYSKEVWWPEYATTESLGRPTGRYRVLLNGVFRRDFTNGVVLVNPHAKGARVVHLRGVYRGSGLGSTRVVTLPPTTGVVLVRS
jgi:hypothetical protein